MFLDRFYYINRKVFADNTPIQCPSGYLIFQFPDGVDCSTFITFYRFFKIGMLVLLDCVFVTSEAGHVTYKSEGKNNGTVCGIYLLADSQNQVEVRFADFDVPCNSSNGVENIVQVKVCY